jgi:hypothetical protein
MQVSRSSLIPGESAQFPMRANAESIPAPIVADFAEYALKSVSRATACLFKAPAACSTVGRRSTGQASWVDRLPVMCCRFSRTRDQGDGAPTRQPVGHRAASLISTASAPGCKRAQVKINAAAPIRSRPLDPVYPGDPDRRDRDEDAVWPGR